MQIWGAYSGFAGKTLETDAGIDEIAEHRAAGFGVAVDDGTNSFAVIGASDFGIVVKVLEDAFLVVNCKSHFLKPF